jgi:hypothetical protein
MKKLLFIGLAFLALGCTAEKQQEQCDCRIEYYSWRPAIGTLPQQYLFMFSEPINFDCNTQTFGSYYNVSNPNYNRAKIVCE